MWRVIIKTLGCQSALPGSRRTLRKKLVSEVKSGTYKLGRPWPPLLGVIV